MSLFTRPLSLLLLLAGCLLPLFLSPSHALTLPNIIDSFMVLQRAPQSSHIWGTSTPNSPIQLTLSPNLSLQTFTSATGSFLFTLPPQPASTPPHHNLTLTDSTTSHTVTLHSVAFGDVFLCSGQSNMELGVSEAFHAEETIAQSLDFPDLRLFTVNHTIAQRPMNDSLSRFPASLGSSWLPSSPLSLNGSYHDEVMTFYGYFSAVCYFSGRDLYQRLAGTVPVGLIETCWSGTPIETWMSPEALAQCPTLVEETAEVPGETVVAEDASADPLRVRTPIPPPSTPSVLWNGMWSAIVPYALTGVLWYQGEANAGNPAQYTCLQRSFILDLREKYGNWRLSFHFVLLAADVPHTPPGPGGWERFRAAQLTTLALPYTGYASAIDLGDPDSPWGGIHPRYKLEVGQRMGRSLIAVDYGVTIDWKGPHHSDIIWPLPASTALLLRYDSSSSANSGLYLNGTKECDDCCTRGSPFAIVGTDGKTWSANTTVYASAFVVVVQVHDLPAGVSIAAVQLHYEMYPQCALYNGEGLPQEPFQAFRYPDRQTTGLGSEGEDRTGAILSGIDR